MCVSTIDWKKRIKRLETDQKRRDDDGERKMKEKSNPFCGARVGKNRNEKTTDQQIRSPFREEIKVISVRTV